MVKVMICAWRGMIGKGMLRTLLTTEVILLIFSGVV